MDAGHGDGHLCGLAAIMAAATPLVIEVLLQRSKRRSEESQEDPALL
jgi:hypothetical protein